MFTLISALGINLLSVVVCCSQPATATLSVGLREHLKFERFDIVTSVRGLPLGVRGGLQLLFGSRGLDIAATIADPGGKFQGAGAKLDTQLPLRRLIAAECSMDHCLVYYERGGRSLTWHVALLHWTPEDTRFESGGLASKRLATIADARNALLSGAIKVSPAFW